MKTKMLLSILVSSCLAVMLNTASAQGRGDAGANGKGSERSAEARSNRLDKGYCESLSKGKSRGIGVGRDRPACADGGEDPDPGTTCEVIPLEQDLLDPLIYVGQICGPFEEDAPEGYFDLADLELVCADNGEGFYRGDPAVSEEADENGAYEASIEAECVPGA